MEEQTCYSNSASTPTSGDHEIILESGKLQDTRELETKREGEHKKGSDSPYQELLKDPKAHLYESLFSAKCEASSSKLTQQTSQENDQNCYDYDNTLPREGQASHLELTNGANSQEKLAQLKENDIVDKSLFSAKSGASSKSLFQQTSEVDVKDYDDILPREEPALHLELTSGESQRKPEQHTETSDEIDSSSKECGSDQEISTGPLAYLEGSDQSNMTNFAISQEDANAFADSEGVGSSYELQEVVEMGRNVKTPITHSTRVAEEADESFKTKTPNIHVWYGNRLVSFMVGFTFFLALIAFVLVVLLIIGEIGPQSIGQQGTTCNDFLKQGILIRGQLDVLRNGELFSVYCDGNGWTLVAKFSNTDLRSWMRSDGYWWYDIRIPQGKYNVPSSNADGISSAFWLLGGNEFKITRTDDPSHTTLLQTKSNCLGGMTFREKITSFGNFRDEVVWANNACRGSCEVLLGGHYSSTEGFQQARCNDTTIGSPSKISFWCDWKGGDGAVMMIGGGGDLCGRADHGIGVTEENEAKFVKTGSSHIPDYNDFGNNGYTTFSKYGLNLWVK